MLMHSFNPSSDFILAQPTRMSIDMAIQAETARRYIEAFHALDGAEFTKLKTPECEHVFAPKSLNMTVSKNNARFEAHMEHLRTILKAFPVYVKKLWEDKTHVTIWATSETVFQEEAKDEGAPQSSCSFGGEYMFVLEMNEDGDKIKRVVEFLDSNATEDIDEASTTKSWEQKI
ncbi:uncharacterized protein PV09_06207 [Verruconis gallopava]|uniref:SnoaL-like domain-containing protein n=1 Tax=Verruconis gallopava TaxID=253628 RepID=A0A0D1YNW3_9PEZI|nr:uncharacterized protein PV09_06207 [Verruconis gallopava]KIW02387.1 hypothetical protein PV09_06207 [Verruconis gallopava]